MSSRPAATLVEVLVAIFVMAIGLLAILVLFPLGAYRMGQAIQDDRMANIAQSADSLARIWNIRQDSLVQASLAGGGPVLVDPTGLRTSGLGTVAGLGSFPRTTLSWISGAANQDYLCMRWFTFLDDIYFATGDPNNGYANLLGGTQFERDNRYSWAYLCQLPNASNPSLVSLSIVAYNRRTLALGGGNLSLPEYAYTTANFDTTTNVVSVTYGAGNSAPPVRAGEWIMDASSGPGNMHGYFYRVVGVADQGGGVIQYEVQTPLRGWPSPPSTTNAGTAVVLEGVAEVFERGTGRLP